MVSSIAWLDTSADEQRRVRELIALFAQPGTVDELGLGQIRDVMSNALFPGTSVLLTRARYFVLVPWAFLGARAPGRSAATVRAFADQSQKALIVTLQGSGQGGVIGGRVGPGVKNLPSTIYWNGLLTFGILRRDVSPEGLSVWRQERDDADELASRVRDDWHPTIPPAPAGFPSTLAGGLDLTGEEASWLRERILESVPETLLAHLVAADHAPDAKSDYAWQDPVCTSVSGAAAEVLRRAHLFSLAMQGASRLYGVLVAEAYEKAGFNAVEAPVERHRDAYLAWLRAVDDDRHLLDAWDQEAFWRFVCEQNQRVTPLTERFVRAWVAGVLDGTAAGALDNEGPRMLVRERERSVKRNQARLSNPKLLELWGGGAGGGALDFRWPTIKTIVTDIQEGLARA